MGGGEQVKIWGDPWLDDGNSFHILSVAVPGFEDMTVNELFVSGTRSWDRELNTRFPQKLIVDVFLKQRYS